MEARAAEQWQAAQVPVDFVRLLMLFMILLTTPHKTLKLFFLIDFMNPGIYYLLA